MLFLFPFDTSRYRSLLTGARTGKLNLQNKDFDTGQPTRAGEYKLADETYSRLVRQLATKNFENASPELRRNVLAFYANLDAPIATKKERRDWEETVRALDKLKATPTQAVRPARKR